MQGSGTVSIKRSLLWLALFAVVLTGFRLWWIQYHQVSDVPEAAAGYVDLSGWQFTDNQSIPIDGEWLFVPEYDLRGTSGIRQTGRPVKVPSDWKSVLESVNAVEEYGIGTYHLRIRLPEGSEGLYGLQIKKATSASKVYIDGKPIGGQNELHTDQSEHASEKGPYTVLFHPTQQEIELAITVSNFDIPFQGGLLGSVHLGNVDAIRYEERATNLLQLVVAVMFLLHSVYAFYIYFAGKLKKQKEVLYYGLLLLLSGVSNLIDDNVVLQLPIPVEWSNKLLLFIFLTVLAVMVKFVKYLYKVETKWDSWLIATYGLLLIAMLAVPFRLYPALINFLGIYYIAGNLYMYWNTLVVLKKGHRDAIFILLFIASYTSNISWGTAVKAGVTSYPYYPFDFVMMMLAIALLLLVRHVRLVKLSEQQTVELQRADQLKDEFLTNTSHEIRNPLHGITNIAYSILTDPSERLTDENRKSLLLLLQIGKQLSFTLNDLLDSTKLKDNRLRIDKGPVDVQGTVSAAIGMVGFLKNGKRITLQSEIPSSFPSVEADGNRLIQILFNLLQNAVKFTEAGTVTVSASHDGKMAAITVKDTGIGIDEAFQDKIFDRYAQAADGASSSGGVGVGLPICRQLVELQGGTISVVSAPGEGAAFTFTLPLATDRGKQAEVGEPIAGLDLAASDPLFEATRADAGSRCRPHILAVDDDWVNLQVLERLLRSEYRLTTVQTAEEALGKLECDVFDLLIIDVMMPGISGYELTKRIRERHSLSELPILLLTARSQSEDVNAGFLAGANDYVAKPVEALTLQARVRALTNLKDAVKEQQRMEAAWLQAQIKPHFLFNTLNTIASLGGVDPDRMVELLTEFGNYLRRSFTADNTQDLIPLSDELDLVKSYLYIEQVRFSSRLHVAWEVEDVDDFLVPPLAIQTIVENAVSHGVLKKTEGGTVSIHIRNFGESCEVTIKDDGAGMTQQELEGVFQSKSTDECGIGLKNTQQRLIRLFGAKLVIESAKGTGTTVAFRIPRTNGE